MTSFVASPIIMTFDFSPQGLFAVSHLRYKRLWVSVGVFLVLAVVVGSVMSLPAPVKVVMLQDKVMHTLAYACLMGWFAQIFRHDLTRLAFVVGLTVMGIVIEFIQGSTGYREYDVLDMVANTSGVVLAWALAYTKFGNSLAWVEGYFFKLVPNADQL